MLNKLKRFLGLTSIIASALAVSGCDVTTGVYYSSPFYPGPVFFHHPRTFIPYDYPVVVPYPDIKPHPYPGPVFQNPHVPFREPFGFQGMPKPGPFHQMPPKIDIKPGFVPQKPSTHSPGYKPHK